MCCLFAFFCQRLNRHSAVTKIFLILYAAAFGLAQANSTNFANAQITYNRYLSELRVQELHNMAIRLEHSIDMDKYVCESYYDYVCGRNRPLFSILGHLPETDEIIQLLTELQNDKQPFEAKQKLMDFFLSCNTVKGLEDCYRETFEYFKPLFAYIITKNYVNESSTERQNFQYVLDTFLTNTTNTFGRNPVHIKLALLAKQFTTPKLYFRPNYISSEYETLKMYKESYQHNVRNLEIFRKRNSTYEYGEHRTILDWSLYVYQSRHKPMVYYYPTFNVHLWMTMFNTTERYYEPKRFGEIVECLKLPQFVNILEEARILAVVYLKSFRRAWEDYSRWASTWVETQLIVEQENDILKQYKLDDRKIFFTLYAQNFCEFGKDLAENVFYLGLKQSDDFINTYECGHRIERNMHCVEKLNLKI